MSGSAIAVGMDDGNVFWKNVRFEDEELGDIGQTGLMIALHTKRVMAVCIIDDC